MRQNQSPEKIVKPGDLVASKKATWRGTDRRVMFMIERVIDDNYVMGVIQSRPNQPVAQCVEGIDNLRLTEFYLHIDSVEKL